MTLRRPTAAGPAVLLGLLCLAAVGCTGVPTHRTGRSGPPGGPPGPIAETPEAPVVLVPGLTGSKLRSRRTGKTVWGRGIDLLWPRDGGHRMALPIAGPPRLEAFAVLETVRLGPVGRGIYGPLLRTLEDHGYRRGRLDPPSEGIERRIDPSASLYTFAYDWRRSAVHAAAELAEVLDELRRARGEERLRVDLICQSSGGYVCRWLAKYGGASLDEAAAMSTSGAPPEREDAAGTGLSRIRIRRLILVGSANGGALRTLRELDRGRRYLAPWGRRMRPETLFTYPALYEDLPHVAPPKTFPSEAPRLGRLKPAASGEGSAGPA